MQKHTFWAAALVLTMGVVAEMQGPRRVTLGDWPELRGPQRDGTSRETGLPDKWAVNGENFLWRAPFGGRSTPVVAGNRVYVQNPSGRGPALQERVMALDADTGKVLWEYKFNIFQSDVPPHRIAWASPAVDPDTGNIYALGGGATALGLSKDGKLLWQRSIGEEFAAFTTHGGRTASPVVDGDLVIVSAAVSNWGEHGARGIRFIALDKRTGEAMYVANPGGRPYDTSYSPSTIASINGMRLLITGLGDGGVHAIKPQTGERVWSFPAGKRAINTGVVVKDATVFMSHGDENFDTVNMGLIAAIDGSQTGEIKARKWAHTGHEFAFSSPVIDGDRLYQSDGGATLFAFNTATGQQLWEQSLGNALKAPLVLADGKLYVGTDGGKFFIIRPHADRAEILSEVQLPVSTNSCCGSEGTPEQIVSGAAVSRGRIFFVTSDAIYAVGPKAAKATAGWAVDQPAMKGDGAAAFVQVVPTELTLRPGDSVRLRARLFDSQGRFLREDKASWTIEGLKATVGDDGRVTIAKEQVDHAGVIKATVGTLTGTARAKVARAFPWTETFEGYADGEAPAGWVSMATGQLAVAPLDGTKVLQKKPLNTLFKRIRAFVGPTTASNYTMQADLRTPTRRRQMGDIGIVAQTYGLILYGTSQQLKIEPWEPETERTVKMPFKWDADTWYRLKLQVENLPNGSVRARGKAWPAAQPEPAAWTIEKIDPIGNRQGAPGFFIDAEFGASIDNVSITPN